MNFKLIVTAILSILMLGACAKSYTGTPNTYRATVGGFAESSDYIPNTNSVKAIAHSINQLQSYSKVYVIGHSDNAGTSAEQLRLSERRARRVADILRAEGVDAQAIVIDSRGSREPVISNDTLSDRAQNRRVEVVVVR